MFLSYDLRNILSDFLYSWQPIDLWFLMHHPKVGEEFLFYILVFLPLFPLLILNVSNVVMHSPLDSSSMKEICVAFALFKPSDS